MIKDVLQIGQPLFEANRPNCSEFNGVTVKDVREGREQIPPQRLKLLDDLIPPEKEVDAVGQVVLDLAVSHFDLQDATRQAEAKLQGLGLYFLASSWPTPEEPEVTISVYSLKDKKAA